MNITYKDYSNTQNRARVKQMPGAKFSHPLEHAELSSFNNYQERPLNTNHHDLSFKGLLYSDVLDASKKVVRKFDSEEFIQITKKHLGPSAENLFNSVKESNQKIAKDMFHINGNEVSFKKKSILHLIWDGVKYPFTNLPADILNGTVSALRKFKPLKKWAEKTYDSTTLKNLRQKSKIESKVNALRGLFETVDSLKGKSEEEISSTLFQRSVKMFDPGTGNYDTKHERSLNRVVSGIIPAFFLANDAYNLSSMCEDNPDKASKEQKTRFKQEVSRIGLNAYITLITLGALQKYINNSKLGIVLNTGLTVLFTESVARLSNGKQITRLTPEQAKAVNDKKRKDKEEQSQYNEVYFKSNKETKNVENHNGVKATEFKGSAEKTKDEKQQKPLLSFGTIMKASAVVIAAGFGIKGVRKIKAVDELLNKAAKPFNDLYKKLTITPDYTMDSSKYNKVLNTLSENGFPELAEKYRQVGESANKLKALDETLSGSNEFKDALKEFRKTNKDASSEAFIKHFLNPENKLNKLADSYNKKLDAIKNQNVIHLGAKDKKMKPVVNFVIAPFKFIYNTIKLPYTLVDKVVKSATKQAPKQKDLTRDTVKALSTSIDKMAKATVDAKEFNKNKFDTFINDNMLKAFNVDNMSNLSNSDLSNLAKTSATAATIWFLMTDNYNMVMLKSNGEDKQGAELKFKERFVQEGSRLFYQTLLIDLFNSTFKAQYHNSLLGMSWITASNTFLGEILNRKSIGMPVKAHSRDELVEIENQKANATGFEKGFYNFMARLTGKKTLAEQRQIKDAKAAEKKEKVK